MDERKDAFEVVLELFNNINALTVRTTHYSCHDELLLGKA